MSISQTFLSELIQEANNTKKLLQAVQIEKSNWQPHEKSMNLKNLAIHVAEIFIWIDDILNYPELDFETYVNKRPNIETSADLINFLDQNIEKGKSILENTPDATYAENWTMRSGETIYFTMPKLAVLRTWVFNHLYHHRGQLTVYLRLLDIKVPGMYGPTADDSTM
jgi:uncharacterized damage-inducible protein DinB